MSSEPDEDTITAPNVAAAQATTRAAEMARLIHDNNNMDSLSNEANAGGGGRSKSIPSVAVSPYYDAFHQTRNTTTPTKRMSRVFQRRRQCHKNRSSSTYVRAAWIFWSLQLFFGGSVKAFQEDLACSVTEEQQQQRDPALHEMEYDIGYGKQSFLAYVEPPVTTFYNNNNNNNNNNNKATTPSSLPSSTKVVPKFNGLATKFINMSNKPVQLYWEPYEGAEQMADMGALAPFGATGSASHPGHRFVFCDPHNDNAVLHRVIIAEHPHNTYVYDPYWVAEDPVATQANLDRELTDNPHERRQYQKWRDTLTFSEHYLNFTGRSYLANYLRSPPKHWMWRADYFGQEHWVETKETHFVAAPPAEELGAIPERGVQRVLRDTDPRMLADYRNHTTPSFNMTLKVISCAPRVFEIANFLSPVEVDHILMIAGGITLGRSSVGDIGKGTTGHQHVEDDSVADTRTSLNSWLPRETSPIFDAIYRRAADLMRIDEALMRQRDEEEVPEWPTKGSVAESLQ